MKQAMLRASVLLSVIFLIPINASADWIYHNALETCPQVTSLTKVNDHQVMAQNGREAITCRILGHTDETVNNNVQYNSSRVDGNIPNDFSYYTNQGVSWKALSDQATQFDCQYQSSAPGQDSFVISYISAIGAAGTIRQEAGEQWVNINYCK